MPAPVRVDLDEHAPPTLLKHPVLVGVDHAMARRLLGRDARELGAPSPGLGDTPGTVIERRHDASLPPEAYTLEIRSGRIEIASSADAGTRHALATLAQLARRFGSSLPGVRIIDRPALPVRGVMLDVSRDKVPTLEHLLGVLDTMEGLKLNHLQLYTEHAFAYTGHEEVWRDSSPITPSDIRLLTAAATERGIELAANQNCLGHLHRWLNLPRYAPLAEITGDWQFETDDGRVFPKHGPHSLCPLDAGSMALITDLLDQLLPCFAGSPWVNIGCDEAFDVGQGRSRAAVAQRGRAAVYFEHLRSVCAVVARHGKRPLFWGDIALRHPDQLALVPEEARALVWGYEGDAPFERDGALLAAAGRGFWCCPGTSAWLSFTGRTSVRHANLRAAARGAVSCGAGGMLVTTWGDQGHRQHWPIELHALAHGAHAAWRADAPDRFDARGAGLHLWGDASGRLGPWLEELGDADAELRAGLRNTNAIYSELHRSLARPVEESSPRAPLAPWEDLAERLGGLGRRLQEIAATCGLDPLVRAELDHTLDIASLAAEKAVACRASPGGVPRGSARIRLAAGLAEISEQHRALWPRRNRPGGLEDSARRYEALIDDAEGTREERRA